MKKSKIIAPAAAILVFSSAAAVTGTVAWFTASNLVSVSGLNMKAEAENGIVIANENHDADEDWGITATASHDGTVESAQQTFIPTSSADLTNWFHGLSEKADDGQDNVKYEKFNVSVPTELTGTGIATGTTTSITSAKNIFLLNHFYVQASSSQQAMTGRDIYIQNLEVEGNTNTTKDLEASLRVAVKYSSTVTIFAPISGASTTYAVAKTLDGDGAATATDPVSATASTASPVVVSGASAVNIPAYTANGQNALKFSVYVWFEGEDVNHKSANIENNLEELSIKFKLGNKEHSA